MASDAHEKLGLRWRDLGHEIVSSIKDKYHGTRNNVDHVNDEAKHVATNVVDEGLETKNEIVSNVKDRVEKGSCEILETIENNEEWIAKTSHVVNEGLKEKLASVRQNIVDGTKGVEQNGIDSGNVAKGFANKQGVELKGKVPSVVNNLEHKMKDIDNNIHKQGASTSQKRLEDYASTMNPTLEVGHRAADKVGDKYKYVEGKIVETYQDGNHNGEGLGHSMLLEGRIGRKVDALVENDKRLNAKLEQTMIETYEGVIGKATKLGQDVLGIVGDTYKDAKVKEKELDKNQRYEQAFEKGGEYIDKAKGKVYEGYEKGAKIGHDIGDKILDKYEVGMEATQSYVHNMKNNIHDAKKSIEVKIRHGQDKYENDNTMSRQDLASKSRQVSHNVKMKTLKGQVNKISDKAQNYYDLEVDDEHDNFYINQYGNTQEVDHVGFLESLGGGQGIGLLEKFNQMTDGIRDRTREHEQNAKKAIKKGVEVAKHITEEGGEKTQENYQNVNDRVMEGGCEVANVVRDTTSQAQEGYKFMTNEIANNGNNLDDSLKGFGQNLAGSTKETNENLKGTSSQEHLCKPTTTSFEDYRYPNDEPLALGTKINEEHVEALHSLGQPKHVQSVIHLSQPQVCFIDAIVDGKLEGPLTGSATIVEISPVVVSGKATASNPNTLMTISNTLKVIYMFIFWVKFHFQFEKKHSKLSLIVYLYIFDDHGSMESDPNYVEMDSKNQNIHRALETYDENSYQDTHFKAGDDNQLFCIDRLFIVLQFMNRDIFGKRSFSEYYYAYINSVL